MNWIRKTLFVMALSLVLLFAFNANKTQGDSIEIEKSASVFLPDSIHTSVFIQPQISHIFVVLQKTSNFSLVKYLDSFLTAIPDFKIKTLFNRFANQDINRCQTVSLLLFPFHSFW